MQLLSLNPTGKRRAGLKRSWLAGALAMLFALSLGLVSLPAQADSGATLQATSTRPGQFPLVSGGGFTANERVDLWLTTPGGTAVGYGYAFADSTGSFTGYTNQPTVSDTDTQSMKASEELATSGQWYVTARGISSGKSVITGFTVATATLQASIRSSYANQVVVAFNGSDFFPGEQVSLWITDSAGTVIPVNYTWADGNGQIPVLYPDGSTDDSYKLKNTVSFTGTTGSYYLTAHGNFSGQSIYTQVTTP